MDPYDDNDLNPSDFEPSEFNPPDDEALDAMDALADAADAVDHATAHIKPYHLRADSGDAIESDLPCIHCDYNLRGQHTDGHCSECGTPVAHSLRADLLKFSDIRWLRGLKQGVMWILIGTFTGIGLGIIAGIAEAAFQSTAPPSFNTPGGPFAAPPTPMPVILIGIVAVLVPNLMTGFGYWRLTETEPPPKKERVCRSLARWTLIPAAFLSILAALFTIGRSDASVFVSTMIDGGAGVLALVGFPAFMIYLRLLALRSQDRGLAKQTSVVMWGLIISMIALAIAVVLIVFIAQASPPSLSGTLGLVFVVGCPLLLSFAVFGIWWIVLLFFYQSRFAKMANLAIKYRRELRERAAV